MIAPALPCPASLDAAEAAAGGYRRVYRLQGPPGEVAIQQVTTRIELRCGDHVLAEYEGAYAEYFRFDARGELGRLGGREVVDIHDFELRRDGWDPMSVRRLIREHDLRDERARLCARAGELRLSCSKRCLLGLGEVQDAEPVQRTAEGGAFGYLREGPTARSAAQLRLRCCRGGEPRDLPLESAVPGGAPTAGAGRWTAPEGWLAHERYTYSFPLQQGRLDDDSGYVVAPLSADPY